MNDKQFIKSFTIKEQAYLIIVGLTGSWMYDATHKELKSEKYCQAIVDQYWSNYAESSLSTIALYARDTIDRCDDCGGRKLFKCNDCEPEYVIVEVEITQGALQRMSELADANDMEMTSYIEGIIERA